MALATQCPHCHTTFRVAHDQLKLRAGLVRCGSCKQIFNGIENLLRPDELAPGTPPPIPQASPAPAVAELEPPVAPPPAPEAVAAPPVEEPAVIPDSAAAQLPEEPVASAPAGPTVAEADVQAKNVPDPLLRMTLLDVTHERRTPARDAESTAVQAEAPQEPDALEQTIDDLQNKPWRKEREAADEIESDALDHADTADYEEPRFVRQARRRQRIGRVLRVSMALGSVLLFAGALAQGAYVFRDQIAARFPEARPLLTQACAFIGCQVGLPAEIDSVAIEATELQTLSAHTFVLSVLLRNQGTTAQAWPHLELTLNDANSNALVRRVFAPRDYLPSAQDMNQGFDAGTEQPIKLFFELAQLKASGYRVYLFYP